MKWVSRLCWLKANMVCSVCKPQTPTMTVANVYATFWGHISQIFGQIWLVAHRLGKTCVFQGTEPLRRNISFSYIFYFPGGRQRKKGPGRDCRMFWGWENLRGSRASAVPAIGWGSSLRLSSRYSGVTCIADHSHSFIEVLLFLGWEMVHLVGCLASLQGHECHQNNLWCVCVCFKVEAIVFTMAR